VEKVLAELGADAKPRLRVMNKLDLLPPQQDNWVDDEHTIYVSAAKGIGMSTLLERIDRMLSADAIRRIRLRVPQKEGKTLAMLEARARIHSRAYKDGLVELEVEAPESLVSRLREWILT